MDVELADRVRVWLVTPLGDEIAWVGSGLEIGASVSTDMLWGYTTPETGVNATVKDAASGTVLGTASTQADSDGYFTMSAKNGSNLVDLKPGVEIAITANGQQSSFTIGEINIYWDYPQQKLEIQGIPNTVMHLELRREGARFWQEIVLDGSGAASIVFDGSYVTKIADRLDLVFYDTQSGQATHQTFPLGATIFLPLVVKN